MFFESELVEENRVLQEKSERQPFAQGFPVETARQNDYCEFL